MRTHARWSPLREQDPGGYARRVMTTPPSTGGTAAAAGSGSRPTCPTQRRRTTPAGDADVSPARMVGDLLTSLEPVLPGVTKAYAGRAGHDSGLLDPLCGH